MANKSLVRQRRRRGKSPFLSFPFFRGRWRVHFHKGVWVHFFFFFYVTKWSDTIALKRWWNMARNFLHFSFRGKVKMLRRRAYHLSKPIVQRRGLWSHPTQTYVAKRSNSLNSKIGGRPAGPNFGKTRCLNFWYSTTSRGGKSLFYDRPFSRHIPTFVFFFRLNGAPLARSPFGRTLSLSHFEIRFARPCVMFLVNRPNKDK